jgi:PAS domain S-box-containing protein
MTAALAGVSIAATAAMYLVDGGVGFATIGWTAGAAAASAGLLDAVRRAEPASRRPWTYLFAASLVWLAAEVARDAYYLGDAQTAPVVVDAVWLVFPLLAAVGLYRVTAADAGVRRIMRLDSVALGGATVAVALSALYERFTVSDADWGARAVAVAYAALFVASFVVVFDSVATAARAGAHRGFLLVLAGLAVQAAAFVLWSLDLLAQSYRAGDELYEGLWSVALLLLAAGGLFAKETSTSHLTSERMLGVRFLSTGVALVTLTGFATVSAVLERPLGARLILLGTLAVTGSLVLLRQWLLSRTLLRAQQAAYARALASHEEAERFFRLSPDMLCVADFNGRFRRVNASFTEVLGWSEDELLEQPYDAFLHPDDRRLTRDHVAEGGGARRASRGFANRMRCKDGTYRWLLWNSSYNRDEGLIYAAARDDTERRAALDRLERANRELEAFAYTTSHDLRAPLISIDGFASSLERRYGDRLDDRGHDYISRIRSNAAALQQLIGDVLDFARASRDEQTIVDADALAREVVAAFAGDADVRVALTTTIPPLRAHPARFKQALTNLVENALRYGRTDDGAVDVQIAATRSHGAVEISVEDNGRGVPEGDRARVFDLFVRGRTSIAVAPDGTGVGLALVKSIAEASGGSARYEHAPHGGARFVLTFPEGTSA